MYACVCVCVSVTAEAGMFAIRDERDYTVHEDFMKVRRGTQGH